MTTKKPLCSNPNATSPFSHHVDVTGPIESPVGGMSGEAGNRRTSLIAMMLRNTWGRQTGAEIRPIFEGVQSRRFFQIADVSRITSNATTMSGMMTFITLLFITEMREIVFSSPLPLWSFDQPDSQETCGIPAIDARKTSSR
jgi:hypothetical protein